MSNDAGDAASKAAKQNGTDAQSELGSADAGIADYMSNVNSQLAAGNPYESKDYLTKQNVATSGAMNSEKDAADQALQDTVAHTGGSSAALAAEEGDIARTGQRDLTNYNATRDTENEDKWLNQRQQLTRDQLSGAQEEGSLYGTSLGGQNTDLKTAQEAEDANNQLWLGVGKASASAAGGMLGGF